MPGDGNRVRLVEGAHADDLERTLDPRSGQYEELGSRRRRLRQECDRTRLDVRQQHVEQAVRISCVLAREECLLELREHADDVLPDERVQ